MNQEYVKISNVSKKFGKINAVKNINIDINKGEFLVIVGPSGSGKTTLLRLMAGFEQVDEGQINVQGVILSSVKKLIPPEKRGMGMVFQQYVLWPHMSVFENIAYPLKARHYSKSEVSQIVNSTLELVGLKELGNRSPHQLSGGQQQRVALARSLALGPKLILFDEPLSNLDVQIRNYMQVEIKRIQKKLNITALYVTHDQGEALLLADRIAVMREGNLEQIGPPEEVYYQPKTFFVANFIGRANWIRGTIEYRKGNKINANINKRSIKCLINDFNSGKNKDILILVRPDEFIIYREAFTQNKNLYKGKITDVFFKGNVTEIRVESKEIGNVIINTSSEKEKYYPDQDIHFDLGLKDHIAFYADEGALRIIREEIDFEQK